MSIEYEEYFRLVTDGKSPRKWQQQLAKEPSCSDRMIHAGTGMGKTLAAGSAWAFNRLVRKDASWPRRLVWCLPMRVLVEQTRDELQVLLEATNAFLSHNASVSVLMGGVETTDWHLYPERPGILVGTQDMLLSRALSRGYASSRAKWPMEFALLNQDVLWIFDEVQLQGVGAVTGTQLQAFRQQESENGRTDRPTHTWWMSATLRGSWLETVDSAKLIAGATEQKITVPKEDQSDPVYTATKPIRVEEIFGKKSDKTFAESMSRLVRQQHEAATPSQQGRVTLVVINTVDEAIIVFKQLSKDLAESTTDVRLIHSRFRGREKLRWREGDDAMLSRAACENPSTNRIIVSTQVIEAGVDISGSCLISELAPWASMVQRFGRAARYGGQADVVIVDRGKVDKDALPYEDDDLFASLEALQQIDDVGLIELAKLEEMSATQPDFDQRLFRFDYINLLQRYDLEELFDTSAELTGEETDVSRFIREGESVSVQLCWFEPSEVEDGSVFYPPNNYQPEREDLCSAPVNAARDWLTGKGNAAKHRERCNASPHAFWWSFDKGAWLPIRTGQDIQPGRTLLVDHRIGGYSLETGFSGAAPKKNETVEMPHRFNSAAEPKSDDKESLSNASLSSDLVSQTLDEYQSIGEHGAEVAAFATKLCVELGLDEHLTFVIDLAARLHDYGKCHPVFRGNIDATQSDWHQRNDIAKAPQNVWRHPRDHRFNWPERSGVTRFEDLSYGQRTGFRHEMASVLGLIELFRHVEHSALSASHSLTVDGDTNLLPDQSLDVSLAKMFVDMPNEDVDLLLYLVASHHGKVRGGLHMTEHDQDFIVQSQRLAQYVPHDETNVPVVAQLGQRIASDAMPVRGVRTGDRLPAIAMTICGDVQVSLPEVTLCTDMAAMGWSEMYGPSWCERTTKLQGGIGIFRLAWLETIVRAADVRISRGEV